MSTLIIIDMQPGFYYSHEVLDQVIKETKKTIQSKHAIINVEFKPRRYGHTLTSLLNLLTGYKNYVSCVKKEEDGSREIYDKIVSRDIYYKKLRVCGVNSDYCVKDTTIGLARMIPGAMIEVVKEACGCPDNTFDWIHFLEAKENYEFI
jgi:nicotinamidase-related amidase